MEEKEKNAAADGAETENKADGTDVTQLVLKTAIRTFLSAVVCLVLIAAIAVTAFPYQAMKIYDDLDNKVRALECAENYVDRQKGKYDEKNPPSVQSRYVTALGFAADYSVALFRTAKDAAAQRYYAEKILLHAENYLAVNAIHERNERINEFNVANQPYYYHPSLYSYRDHLARYDYLARCILDERDSMLYNGALSPVSLIAGVFLNSNLVLTQNNIDSFAEIFNQLSAMMRYEFSRMGIADVSKMTEAQLGAVTLDAAQNYFSPLITRDRDAGTNFTLLFREIEGKFEQFRQYALDMPHTNKEEALKRLYVFEALSVFADNCNSALIVLSGNEQYTHIDINDAMRWQLLGVIHVEEQTYTMRDYYNVVMMPQYARILTGK